MNRIFTFLLFAFWIIASGTTVAQLELPEDKVKASISLNQDDCSLEVVVDVDVVVGAGVVVGALVEDVVLFLVTFVLLLLLLAMTFLSTLGLGLAT